MIIDTHAHLQFPEFDSDMEDVLRRASDAGVGKIINVGCSLDACEKGVSLMEKYDEGLGGGGDGVGDGLEMAGGLEMAEGRGVELFATLGLHPYDVLDLTDDVLKDWEEKIKRFNDSKPGAKKIVAIGEIGLDYFKAETSREVQQDAFKRQIEFAQKMNLPIVVHNRESDEDTMKILEESGLGQSGAIVKSGATTKTGAKKVVFHCYGSSLEFAREVWNRGFFTSFTGIITYPNAASLREVVEECPLDRWMVETDCPYLAPQSFRGQRNEPSYVKEILEKVAELKGISFENAEKMQEENAREFYGV